jgi:hypothetical protein
MRLESGNVELGIFVLFGSLVVRFRVGQVVKGLMSV